MNKQELVSKIAEKAGITKKQAEDALNAFTSSVEEALVARDKVQLIGFGTFEARERQPRQGRNPQKPGETIEIPGGYAPAFKSGKSLKDAVSKG